MTECFDLLRSGINDIKAKEIRIVRLVFTFPIRLVFCMSSVLTDGGYVLPLAL